MACAPSTVCGRPASFSRAARQVSARAASISVCMSASLCWIAWKPRDRAAERACAPWRRRSRRRARPGRCPTACAAMPMRPPSSVESAMRMPGAGAPSRSPGVSSKARSAVEEEFSPSFSSSRVTREAVRAAAHEEAREMRSSSSLGEDDEDVGVRAVGDPLLGAGDAAVVVGARAHRARVAAAARLGQRERGELVAAGRAAGRAARSARRCRGRGSAACPALVCTATRHADAGVGARELLEHEHVGEEVRARAAVLAGHAHAHQPELAELREDVAGGSGARGPTRRRAGRRPRRRSGARGRGSRAARR